MLCPRFAVIRKGRLVAQTSPAEARAAIEGTIFEGRWRREELDEIQARGLRSPRRCWSRGGTACASIEPDGAAAGRLRARDGDPRGRLPRCSCRTPRGPLAAEERGPGARRGGRAMSLAAHRRRLRPGARPHLPAPAVLDAGRLLASVLGAVDRHMQIGSGDSSVGGTKAWITSEFAVSRSSWHLMALLYTFFVSVAAGMASSPTTRRGSASCCTRRRSGPASTSGASSWRPRRLRGRARPAGRCSRCSSTTWLPNADGDWRSADRSRWGNYLRPALVFALPTLVFYLGVAFFAGRRWRRPILVFLFPVAVHAVLRLLPLELVADVARPADEPAADARRPRRLPLAQRDLAQGGPRAPASTTRPASALDAVRPARAWPSLALGLRGVVARPARIWPPSCGATGGDRGRARRRASVAIPAGAAAVAALALRLRGRCGCGSAPSGSGAGTLEVARTELRNLLASPGALSVRAADPDADARRQPDRRSAPSRPAAPHPGHRSRSTDHEHAHPARLPAADVLHGRVARARASAPAWLRSPTRPRRAPPRCSSARPSRTARSAC